MYRVGVSREFLGHDGSFTWGDIGLGAIERQAEMSWQMIAADEPLDEPDSIAALEAMLVLRQQVNESLLSKAPELRHVSRWGAGLERIDLEACTRHGVIVTSTPQGGRRPVAGATLGLVLALMHHVVQKDRLVRTGKWSERGRYIGTGLSGKTVGIIGFGNIGRDFAALIAPFEAKLIAHSPRADVEQARSLGVALVDLPTLMKSADVVVVTCALTERTKGLLSAESLELMKPTSFLINSSRGEVLDEAALVSLLRERRIAGAALDVFLQEPLPSDHPLTKLDNVILTPHNAAQTDQMVTGNAKDAIGSIIQVALGRRPTYVANPDVLAHPRWSRIRPERDS